MDQDTSIGVVAETIVKPAKAAKSKTLPQTDLARGNIGAALDEQNVWLSILSNWIANARDSGLLVEVYDMRPQEQGIGVVILGGSYHAACGTFSRGNTCRKCGVDVVTEGVVTLTTQAATQ